MPGLLPLDLLLCPKLLWVCCGCGCAADVRCRLGRLFPAIAILLKICVMVLL